MAETRAEKVTVGWRVRVKLPISGFQWAIIEKRGEYGYRTNTTNAKDDPATLAATKHEAHACAARFNDKCEARLFRVTRRKRVSVEAVIDITPGALTKVNIAGYRRDASTTEAMMNLGFRDGDRVRITRIGGGK